MHFLQIWLVPERRGITPSHEQKSFAQSAKRARLRVVASPDGRDGSVRIHTDSSLYAGVFERRERAQLDLA